MSKRFPLEEPRDSKSSMGIVVEKLFLYCKSAIYDYVMDNTHMLSKAKA